MICYVMLYNVMTHAEADPNAADLSGETPLLEATRWGGNII